ncbi:MAG: hypothetical protein V1723_01435 [Candidatus Uhrbacteria bacterium]
MFEHSQHPRGYTRGEIISIIGAAVILATGTWVSAQDIVTPAEGESPAMEEDVDRDRPDPRECRDAQKQISDQVREIKRIEKLLKKTQLVADIEKIGALRGLAQGFGTKIKADCSRDTLQEFYDEQIWDSLNELRAKAELPQQFKQIDKELKRLEKQATAKRILAAGIDAEKFKANIEAVKQAFAEAQSELSAGNYQEAQEAMQPIYEGMHPGEMNGVITRLSDLGTKLKRVKNAEVRAELQELIQPIIEAANDGDFREANFALNDAFNDLQRIFDQLARSRSGSSAYQQKIDQIAEKIGVKLEENGDNKNQMMPERQKPQQAPEMKQEVRMEPSVTVPSAGGGGGMGVPAPVPMPVQPILQENSVMPILNPTVPMPAPMTAPPPSPAPQSGGSAEGAG